MPHVPRVARLCFGALVSCSLVLSAAAQAQDDVSELGKEVFLERAEPKCGVCHALVDAGTSGDIGPNLDELKPSEDMVKASVTNGIEAMPAYDERLSEEEIAAVAKYVASVAGQQ